MARRTTSKTGTTKRATASRRSKPVTQAADAADADSAKIEDIAAGDESPQTESPATESATPESAPVDASGTPLADGPAQMGEDTAGALDVAEDATLTESVESAGEAKDDAPSAVTDADESVAADPLAAEDSVATEASPSADDLLAAPDAPDANASTGTDSPEGSSEAEPAVSDDVPEPQEPPVAPPAAPPAPMPAPEKRGGFFPMLLGGLIAGGIGYGVHYYQTTQQAGSDELSSLRAELADLRASVAQGPDLSALEAQIAALQPATPADLGGLEAAIDDLRGEIAALPEPDTSGLQAQIDNLRSTPQVDLGPLQDSLESLDAAYASVPDQIAALQAEMADLRALATAEIAAAEAAVDTALASAGLDRIRAALVTGEPFDDAVAQLQQAGADIPAALTSAAASGVQTADALQASYPQAARAALAASLQSAPADSTTEKLGNFFRAQIGARSLAPRDGDDPDAVTARAGAAVDAGDLAAARDELSGLPDAGRAAMQDWLGAVDTRLNAGAALDMLQAEITTE